MNKIMVVILAQVFLIIYIQEENISQLKEEIHDAIYCRAKFYLNKNLDKLLMIKKHKESKKTVLVTYRENSVIFAKKMSIFFPYWGSSYMRITGAKGNKVKVSATRYSVLQCDSTHFIHVIPPCQLRGA